MIKIGITGGIGSGKSFISKLFEIMNVPVYNADERAKEITQTNSDIRKDIISIVGKDSYVNDKLNKRALADFIFSSEKNRKKINSIIHPRVYDDFKRWAEKQTSEIIAMECAILYECGFDKLVDSVVTIFAPLELRLKRAMVRDNASEEQIMSRIKAQMDDEEKKMKADFVIQNDESKELIPQVLSVIDNLKSQNK